jgi:serine/threonine-protein kinase HipA
MNGRLVGEVRMATSGAIAFQYDQTWLDWEGAMPISLSLPLQETAHQGAVIFAYLENLLPDNNLIRERVAAKVGARGTDAYHLLEKIGRDCVGALQFFAGDAPANASGPGVPIGEPVSEAQIATILRNLATAPLGIDDDSDSRIADSIAVTMSAC